MRHIPLQNEKIKRPLEEVELIDLAYAVGSQLGRGHALSVVDCSAREMVGVVSDGFSHYGEVAAVLQQELGRAHGEYVRRARPLAESTSKMAQKKRSSKKRRAA